jgi:hypothetical protein
MKSSPENRLARQLSAGYVFATVFFTFALSLLLTACGGASAGTIVPAGKAPLSLAPATIDFGTVQLNAKTVTSVINVTNVGTFAEIIESATILPTTIFSLQGWTGPITINPGHTVQLRTTFAPKSAGNYSGTLTLATSRVAPVGSVISPNDGPGPQQPVGQVNIGISGAASPENSPPPTIGVSVSPSSVVVQSGHTEQFTSSVTGTSNTAVTWSAVLGSISSSGVYQAPTVASQTQDTVSAVSVADSKSYASVPVTVTGGSVPIGVSVSPSSVVLQSGHTKQFTSSVTGTSNTAVTWSAVLGSITSSGVYTAPTVASQTQDTVSAVSVADSTKYASVSVTISTLPTAGPAYSQNANSVTTKLLPGDVLSHCYGNTADCSTGDAIAKCAMTDCGGLSELNSPTYMGTFVKASPGRDDFGNPVYYSTIIDPWYSITAATPSGAQSVVFRAPSGALFSEGAEQELTVWDQSTGWVVELYSCCGPETGRALPVASSCGSTKATACTISNTYQSAASDLFAAQDYGYSPHPNASNGFAPAAAMVWEAELQNGTINHALMFTVDCVNAATPFVFPATTNPGVCGAGNFGPQNSARPSAGTLLFVDYTAEQIASFNLPAWQTSLLTAFSKYGAYVSETQGQNTGITLAGDENLESSEAWKYNNTFSSNPFWPWITSQNGLDGTLDLTHTGCTTGSPGSDQSEYRCIGAVLANIPRTLGPEGSDTEGNSCTSGSGCYPSGHLHVADVCVAKGFANSSGGCS